MLDLNIQPVAKTHMFLHDEPLRHDNIFTAYFSVLISLIRRRVFHFFFPCDYFREANLIVYKIIKLLLELAAERISKNVGLSADDG